ncbi:transcriptional regulator [Kocuria sp.]|uniref:transcriptional regulator n=1 Tax=Kocuria sp. TaxID=1871328 RepID=UPI0026DEADB8|nr:transcriptional regulator [Kocuria sp.]MDO5618301.1 transcriptional regulator [Kocuria sp.]
MKNLQHSSIALAAVLSGTLLITGCGGSNGDSSTDESQTETTTTATETATDENTTATPTDAATDEASETETAEAGSAADASGDQTEVEVGETIEDPDMGDSIEVVSVVRDFQSEEEAETIDAGGEVVLMEVKVTPGTEYGGLVSAGNFKISWDDGADFWNNKTRSVESEMESAGFTPFEDVSRRDGGEHTGWIAFVADERADTYLVEYTRRGADVIGSDETIDEFTTEFEIPAA